MAPLPKRRHSTRRQGKRRNAIEIEFTEFDKCKNCGKSVQPHRACRYCGFYNGKLSLKIKEPKKSKDKAS
jgi:large subunit ribosomal protein L32